MPQPSHNFILLSCTVPGCAGVLGFLAPGVLTHTTHLQCPLCKARRTIYGADSKQPKESTALMVANP